nr:unnamed protein product [Callosobruchus analis]
MPIISFHRDEEKRERYDRLDHLVVYQEKQTRCNVCHKNCNFFCQKCSVTLHPKNCFVNYHTL